MDEKTTQDETHNPNPATATTARPRPYTDEDLKIGDPDKSFVDTGNEVFMKGTAIPFGGLPRDAEAFTREMNSLERSGLPSMFRPFVRAAVIAGVRVVRRLENHLADTGVAEDAVTGEHLVSVLLDTYSAVMNEGLRIPPQFMQGLHAVLGGYWRYGAQYEAAVAKLRDEAGITQEGCGDPNCTNCGPAVRAASRRSVRGSGDDPTGDTEETAAPASNGDEPPAEGEDEPHFGEALAAAMEGRPMPKGAKATEIMPGVTVIEM